MLEFGASLSGSVKGSALTLLDGVFGTAPSYCTVGTSPRHQEAGRVSRTQVVHSMACECIQVCARSNVERLVEELPSDM